MMIYNILCLNFVPYFIRNSTFLVKQKMIGLKVKHSNYYSKID